LALRLSRAGLLLLVDHARPEMLGALVRALLPEHPELEVYTEVHHVLDVPVGATLVLVPRPEDADWLNINRPVFAQRELKVVLFSDKDTSTALARQAVDFFDWISHRVECPEDPPPFAVAGIRSALAARTPGIVWLGGDLRRTFTAARPHGRLHQVSAAQSYQALVAEIQEHRREWIAWTDIDSQFRLRRARWALAEAGHRTRTILVAPVITPSDWWPIHAQVTWPKLARARLTSIVPFPGRLAALTNLEPEALRMAELLLQRGSPWKELEAQLLKSQDPGITLGVQAYHSQVPPAQINSNLFAPLVRRVSAQDSAHSRLERPTDATEKQLWVHALGKNAPWVQLSEQALRAGDIEVADVWAQHATNANLPDATLCLARVRYYQGKYAEAEILLLQSLTTTEQTLGRESPGYGTLLQELARVLESQGKYAEAENLLRQARDITERVLGTEHPLYGASLQLLASVIKNQGKYTEAESLLRQALDIFGRALGMEHPLYGNSLQELASVIESQGKHSEAEHLRRQSLAIKEQALGKEHPDYAASLQELARVLESQGKYSETEHLRRQSLAIFEQSYGKEHPDYAASLQELARVLHVQGKYSEAERFLRQALAIFEQSYGKEHLDYGASLHELARVLQSQGKYSEAAEHLLRQALAIFEQTYGKDHLYFGISLRSLASALEKQGKYTEAESLLRQSLSVVERVQGKEHPRLCSILTIFGSMLIQQSRLQEGERLLHRAVEIARNKLGEHHPETAEALALLALTQSRLGKPEAKDLARQALEGLQQSLGPEHPTTQELKPQLLRILQDESE
jgi:tetratricopeptide (TPR) repeat protein